MKKEYYYWIGMLLCLLFAGIFYYFPFMYLNTVFGIVGIIFTLSLMFGILLGKFPTQDGFKN